MFVAVGMLVCVMVTVKVGAKVEGNGVERVGAIIVTVGEIVIVIF